MRCENGNHWQGSGLELLDELKGRCPVLIFSAQMPHRNITEEVAVVLTKSATSNDQLLSAIRKVLNTKEATLPG